LKRVVLLLLFITNLFAVDASMEIVKKNSFTPVIALEDSTVGSDLSENFRMKFHNLLIGDYKVSGHIDTYDKYQNSNFEDDVYFNRYKNRNIDLLLKYKFELNSDKSLSVLVKLFDINSQKYSYTNSYHVSKIDRFPFLAHKIAIDVNNYLKAPPIDWMQKFVIFAKYNDSKESEIVISDYTLTYQQTIIKGGLNIFPKWANKKQDAFYYTAYEKKPTLYKVNLYSGERSKVITSNGMLTCSDVSEDGTKLLLTMAPKDQPDIYVYDLNRKSLDRVTSYKGIDVNGSFVENDQRVVFVSDRLGHPNVFAKSANSSKATERLVYHGRNNNSCTTHKHYIVYVSRDTHNEFDNNSFNLYLISTKSDYIRQLTSNGVNQFPKFSVDGESVLFIKNYEKQSALGIIRLNYNKSYLFPLRIGKIQSIDW
jgi:TolB protein